MLQLAKGKGVELSNLQLQKLVYIAHGYLLGWKGRPLVKDPIQAWRYGPVIEEVYHHFKESGRNKVPTDGIDALEFDPIFDPDEEKCLSGVLELYGRDTPESLISITHQDDTPWDKIWNTIGKRQLFAEIPNDLIKDHYREVISSPKSVNGL
jgi:uncharacterized phage-associated protein